MTAIIGDLHWRLAMTCPCREWILMTLSPLPICSDVPALLTINYLQIETMVNERLTVTDHLIIITNNKYKWLSPTAIINVLRIQTIFPGLKSKRPTIISNLMIHAAIIDVYLSLTLSDSYQQLLAEPCGRVCQWQRSWLFLFINNSKAYW